jgi:hypothetical protein
MACFRRRIGSKYGEFIDRFGWDGGERDPGNIFPIDWSFSVLCREFVAILPLAWDVGLIGNSSAYAMHPRWKSLPERTLLLERPVGSKPSQEASLR